MSSEIVYVNVFDFFHVGNFTSHGLKGILCFEAQFIRVGVNFSRLGVPERCWFTIRSVEPWWVIKSFVLSVDLGCEHVEITQDLICFGITSHGYK